MYNIYKILKRFPGYIYVICNICQAKTIFVPVITEQIFHIYRLTGKHRYNVTQIDFLLMIQFIYSTCAICFIFETLFTAICYTDVLNNKEEFRTEQNLSPPNSIIPLTKITCIGYFQ